jgi:hypothetical protein
VISLQNSVELRSVGSIIPSCGSDDGNKMPDEYHHLYGRLKDDLREPRSSFSQ